MSRASYCAWFWNALFGFEDSVVDNLFIILQERSWASADIFPWRGATSTFRLSFFRLRTMQCKWTFTKRFTLSTPKKFPHPFTTFAKLGYHPISLLLWTSDNWIWIGLELSTNAFAVPTLVCAGWTLLLKILPEMFSTLWLSEMLFRFINYIISIFRAL